MPFHRVIMGQVESKDLEREFGLFSAEEKTLLKQNFGKLSAGKKNVDRSLMQVVIENSLELPSKDALVSRLCDSMTGQINTIHTITLEGYVHCASVMIKGLPEDRADQLLYLSTGRRDSSASASEIQWLIERIIGTGFHLLSSSKEAVFWHETCSPQSKEDSISRLAAVLAHDLISLGKDSYEMPDLKKCLLTNSLFINLFNLVSHRTYQLPTEALQLIPLCRGLPTSVYPSWLTLADIVFINSSLPVELRSEWRFLFSSAINGESFSSLIGAICDKGPTVLVVQDTDGHVFGGFAAVSWNISPQFAGNDKNFLFSLGPRMAAYNSTGFNGNYQYLNIQQQTFPNGLGMGGQLEYFGLWIDSDYGKGKCSPSCSTFNCRQLSSQPEFRIERLEVWAVGPEPVKDEDESEARPSILDADVEGQAMLRMMNRGPFSEGMREDAMSDIPEDKTFPFHT